MKPIRLLLLVLMLLPVVGGAPGRAQAQGEPLDAYMLACTTTETDLDAAAAEFEVSLEELEYVNRAREDYREPYLIRPGCFFSTQLNQPPLYVDTNPRYPFVLEIIEADLTFSQLSPEGYFLRAEGYGSYLMYDFSYDQDADGRWVWAGMALLTGGAPFGGHAVAYNGAGFDVRLEYDWIGQSFLQTFLVPAGPIVSLRGYYDMDGGDPLLGGLTAYDYDSGDTLWELPLEAMPRALFAAPAGTVALVEADQIRGLDAASGEALWTAADPDAQAIAADDALVVWSAQQLSARDPLTGEARWEVVTPDLIVTHLAYAAGTIVAAGADGQLAAYAAEDGARLWEAEGTPDLTTADLVCEADHDCWRIAAGPDSATVEQFALADGALLTDYALPGETADSELKVRVQDDGWVLITGRHLHARTPALAH